MKKGLRAILLLAIGLAVALAWRVKVLRAAAHGPAGGTGVIEGVDVNVTSRLPARIAKEFAREGDLVKEGAVLVQLNCDEEEARLSEAEARADVAKATLDASEANAKSAVKNVAAARGGVLAASSQIDALLAQERLAKLELARNERLYSEGAVTQAVIDAAQSREATLQGQIAAQRANASSSQDKAAAVAQAGDAAQAQIEVAQSNLELAKADVDLAKTQTAECTLTAPRSGMIATRNYYPGEAVQPGSVIFTITDVSDALTRFYLPNQELAAAAPGRAVTIVADAYPGRTFRGTIYYVSPKAEFTPRNVQTREDRERLVYAVKVRIPNKDMLLREGMPVEVQITGTEE